MRKRILLIIAVVAVITATAAAYHRSISHQTPDYVTAAVTRGSVVDAVAATGTLQAVTTVQVGSQVSGTIKVLNADFNSEVHKGQVVAELDPSLFQTQVEQARASLIRLQADADRAAVTAQDAQSKLTRAQELFKQQLISKQDLDTAEADARQAQAAVKSAQAQITQARAALNQSQVNLDHTIIRAPIDGIVISRSVDVGQTVASSLQAPTLFVIANDLTRMQVNASIDESDIGRITAGQPVSFTVDAYPGEPFTGTVSQVRLEPKVESNVVSYTTIIDVPNPSMKLKPGMTATVNVEVARADDVLKVPTSALRFAPEGAESAAGTSAASDGSRPRATSGSGGTTGVAGTSGSMGRDPRSGTGGARRARIWVLDENGQPKPVPVTPGVSDGATTALVEAPIAEGTQVITGMASATVTASGAQSTSPFLPQRRGGARGRQGQGGRTGGAR
jgi:HlyD family secretion protein